MMDCIFCNIANGKFDSAKIFEDDNIFVFLDINPVTKGHCLVIPKQHFESIFDIEQTILQKIIVVSKNISEKIKISLNADGIRLAQSNGKAAGQEIMHFHLHVIPRYQNDGISGGLVKNSYRQKADFEELKKLAKEIIK